MTDTELDVLSLRERLAGPSGPYAAIDLVATTGSTNADLLAAAAAGGADHTVLIAEEQTAGRGRRGRGWASPGGGVYLSVLVRPAGVPPARLGTLSLVAGLALVAAAETAGVDASLKWPNDLLVGDGGDEKGAGVLSEVADGAEPAAVVGVGINVRPLPAGIEPGPGGLPAGSLGEHGAAGLDRTAIAAAWLREFADLEARWRRAGGDLRGELLERYRQQCDTIGRRVRAELPDGSATTGLAVDVDADGRLLVRTDDGARAVVSAADVVYLRAG